MTFGRRSGEQHTASRKDNTAAWWWLAGIFASGAILVPVAWEYAPLLGALKASGEEPPQEEALDAATAAGGPALEVPEAQVYAEPIVNEPPVQRTANLPDFMGLSLNATIEEVRAWSEARGATFVCPLAGEIKAYCEIQDLAGVPGNPTHVKALFVPGLPNGNLKTVWIRVPPSRYPALLAAAQAKYGAPTEIGQENIVTPQGATFSGERAFWDGGDRSVFVRQFGGNPNMSGFSYELRDGSLTEPAGSF